MNKYAKWTLSVLLILAVVFAAGCAKNAMQDDIDLEGEYIESGRGVMTSGAKMAMPVEYEVAHDEAMLIEPMPPEYYPYPDGHYGDGDDVDASLKIIRSADMRLEVDDYFLASQKVEAFAKKYNGYVSSSNAHADYNDKHSGTVTIRIPDMHFDAVIAELSMLGEIKSKNVHGQDVTEEYIDLQSRIKNSEAHEEQLVKMFGNATDVKEMMQVERELNRVREEIERNKGRLRYLENRVDYSTISVYMYEEQPVVKEWGVLTSIKNALNNSLATLRWMIELFGWLLPLVMVGVIVGLLVKLLRRGKRVVRKR